MNNSQLKRERHPMPDYVKTALQARGLVELYAQRPAYQQNDYIGWIIQAKKQATQEKRLKQMLDELEAGGIYMKMPHPASARPRR